MSRNHLSNSILVSIINYDFSANASLLKGRFSEHFATILIDADSPTPPSDADITIANTYYPGLFNTATDYALKNKYEYLMLVASDLKIDDVTNLCRFAAESINDESIGVYTPSVTKGSRTAYPILINKFTSGIRESGIAEGFFFLCKTKILEKIYPIPSESQFGWGFDLLMCHHAYGQGNIVVVDDRIEVFHPASLPSHQIDATAANHELFTHISPDIVKKSRDTQEYLNSNIRIFNNTSTLDLGCGIDIKNPFSANNLYGIDLYADQNKQVYAADLNIQPIPFESSTFEYCTAFDFIEHISRLIYCPDKRLPFIELMNEIHRILKPGGIFLSVTPAYPYPEAFQDPTHVNFITAETFPKYFCEEFLWAKMCGFKGNFRFASQEVENNKLITVLRALKR